MGIISLRLTQFRLAGRVKSNAQQLAARALDELGRAGASSRATLAELTKLALSEDEAVAESASRAIFTGLVEPLADSFKPEDVTRYNRAFAQVISICRADARARALDAELSRLGLVGEEDLIARVESLRRTAPGGRPERLSKPQRVIILSRVTLGADVAITSVLLERMKREYPGAEMVLLGGKKIAELFGGDSRVRTVEVGYGREGTLLDRLLAWTEVLARIGRLSVGLDSDRLLIVDPDSRLTQLGMLPVTAGARPDRSNYLFFPSREYRHESSDSLSQLASAWLDELYGESARIYPSLSLRRSDLEAAERVARRINNARPSATLNFGVGENPAKRLGGDFEASLSRRLLEAGFGIILDKGAGEEEMRRANAVISRASNHKIGGRPIRVVEISEENLAAAADSPGRDPELLVWNGRIGMLAALIAHTDLYIGYDSAGQHIAAALGVPCIDVFAGFSSQRFLDRWRPGGKSETRVVPVDESSSAAGVVEKVLDHAVSVSRRRN